MKKLMIFATLSFASPAMAQNAVVSGADTLCPSKLTAFSQLLGEANGRVADAFGNASALQGQISELQKQNADLQKQLTAAKAVTPAEDKPK